MHRRKSVRCDCDLGRLFLYVPDGSCTERRGVPHEPPEQSLPLWKSWRLHPVPKSARLLPRGMIDVKYVSGDRDLNTQQYAHKINTTHPAKEASAVSGVQYQSTNDVAVLHSVTSSERPQPPRVPSSALSPQPKNSYLPRLERH